MLAATFADKQWLCCSDPEAFRLAAAGLDMTHMFAPIAISSRECSQPPPSKRLRSKQGVLRLRVHQTPAATSTIIALATWQSNKHRGVEAGLAGFERSACGWWACSGGCAPVRIWALWGIDRSRACGLHGAGPPKYVLSSARLQNVLRDGHFPVPDIVNAYVRPLPEYSAFPMDSGGSCIFFIQLAPSRHP